MTVYEVRDTSGKVWQRLMYRAMAEEVAARFNGFKVREVKNFIEHNYNAKECRCTSCMNVAAGQVWQSETGTKWEILSVHDTDAGEYVTVERIDELSNHGGTRSYWYVGSLHCSMKRVA